MDINIQCVSDLTLNGKCGGRGKKHPIIGGDPLIVTRFSCFNLPPAYTDAQ